MPDIIARVTMVQRGYGRHLKGPIASKLTQKGPTEWEASAFGGAVTVTAPSQHEALARLNRDMVTYMTKTPFKDAGSLKNRDGSEPQIR